MERTGRSITRCAVVLAAAVAILSCSSSGTSAALTQADLLGTWSGTVAVRVTDVTYYWEFEEGDRYRSYDGCNWGGGTYSVTDGHVTFGESASTARACLGEGADSGVGLTDPPDFAIEDSGQTLVVQTELGEVRLPRVDSVPIVD